MKSPQAKLPRPLSASEALSKILATAKPVTTETVPLAQSIGRTLRQAVCADRPLPPYDRAAMDGYACRARDCASLPVQLRSIGVVPAGAQFTGKVGAGECVRIMTGGSVPAPCDLIVPIEEVIVIGDARERVTLRPKKVTRWHHIHRCGSDARAKQQLLPGGHCLRAVDLATLASVGCVRPAVSRRLRVGVVATGREVVAIDKKPRAEQIRESNGTTLAAILTAQPGMQSMGVTIAPDRVDGLARAFAKTLAASDVLLTTGGVSAGDFDLVPQVLHELGVRRIFHKLRIKPGKPLWFGVSKTGQLVFGLPGNPVSTLTTFHEFVLPALRRMAGQSLAAARPQAVYLPLFKDHVKKTPLLEFARARLRPGSQSGYARVEPAGGGGSGDFYSLTQSDGVLVLPEDEHEFEAGQLLEFHPWNFA